MLKHPRNISQLIFSFLTGHIRWHTPAHYFTVKQKIIWHDSMEEVSLKFRKFRRCENMLLETVLET